MKSRFLRTHIIPKKRKKTSHCSMSTRSQLASSAGKFETQAQILAKRHHWWLLASGYNEQLFSVEEPL